MREKMMKNLMKRKGSIRTIKQKVIKTTFVVFLLVVVSLLLSETKPAYEAFGQVLPRNAQTVSSFLQLESALKDSTTTTVYLDADIVVPVGGITINPAKPSLTIDGTSPIDGTEHTITDCNTAAATDTISLRTNGSLKSITLQNITFYGKNYYGPVCIYDVVTKATVTYNNVNYYGPQLTYNTNGTAIYQDCYVELGRFGGVSAPQELVEASHVIFRGDVSITQVEAQAFEIIYSLIGGGAVEVGQNADVSIKTYSDSGFFLGAAATNFVVYEGAVFRFEGGRRFWELRSFWNVTIQPHASVYIEIKDLINDLLRVDGSLQVGANAEMILMNKSKSSLSLINMNGGGAYFKNPKRIVLYNAGYRPLYYTVAGELFIDVQQIRYWNVAADLAIAGSFSDVPLRHWAISDGNNVEVTGEIGALGGNFTTLTTNYNPDDTGGKLDKDTFHMGNARVLAFGRLHLTGEYIHINETASKIVGLSEEGSNIEVTYTDGEPAGTSLVATTGSDGRYQIFPQGIITEDAIITVKSNKLFLFSQTSFPVRNQAFKFSIESAHIQFETAYLFHETQIVKRVSADWDIVVTDNRGTGSSWDLTAKLISPLSYTDEEQGAVYTLENALIFIDSADEIHLLETDEEVMIKRHTTTNDVDVTAVIWDEDKGILARIEPYTALLNIPYEGKIRWILKSAP